MCGLAGALHLQGSADVPFGVLASMAKAMVHRGPDGEGCFEERGIGLVSRRLSVVDLAEGRQPVTNEDGSVVVVFNGELFDYPDLRKSLMERGHRLRTHCDTEVIPHLWEDHGEQMFERLRGQFAIALWDKRRRQLILARDRFGISPLHWAKARTPAGEWLLFASEIKTLLASRLITPRPNLRGINQIFEFIGLPGPLTCFEGVRALPPGRYISVKLNPEATARVEERTYWDMDFPDRGQEDSSHIDRLANRFEEVLYRAVERRLRADVPVVSYLSGGVDSTTILAMASKVAGRSLPCYTIRIDDPALDETKRSSLAAVHLNARPQIVDFGKNEALTTYPELVRVAECPVVDTSCAALLMLARRVHADGYKVTLTGEGADEWLAGYPWYKIDRVLSTLDLLPGIKLGLPARRLGLWLTGEPQEAYHLAMRSNKIIGGHSCWMDFQGLISFSKFRFFSDEMMEAARQGSVFEDLDLDFERTHRWHPLNRDLYLGGKTLLPGLLLQAKGDRVAMHSSVEARYPFLDEDVFAFLASVHPRHKLKGLREKHILRVMAERWVPVEVARRRKAMFRAPFDSFHAERLPAFVDQLLSPESLRRTGYFNPQAVAHWRTAYRNLRAGSKQRLSVEMGLAGVVSTQLWHHTFVEAALAELPGWQPPLLAARLAV